MRIQALAAVLAVTVLAGCSGTVDVEETYCPLASVPYKTPAELSSFREKAKEVFAEEEKYDGTDRNKRIVNAALALNEASKAYELRLKNPKLFSPGDDQGMAGAVAELKAACAAKK